jgi:DNA (cytosine-5)-methyltransferase 1
MIRLATVFSGIGAIEQALLRLNIPHEIVFACDNGDVELTLFDKATKKEYADLKTKRGKRSLSPEEKTRLEELSLQENQLAEDVRARVRALATPIEKKEYVDSLYANNSKKVNHVQKTYEANYTVDSNHFHQDIRFLDGRDYNGQVDLLVGGSPCQAFSSVGAQSGLNDTRGTLFYEFARIIQEVQPKVFIYENVRGLTTHDNGNTWKVIQRVFTDVLQYDITEPQLLNAADYGIPQTRRRVFVVGIRKDLKHQDFQYPEPQQLQYTMQDFLENNCAYGQFGYNKDGSIYANKVAGTPDPKFILTDKVRDYVLCSGTKTFKTSTKTDLPIARTLVKTMTQHHRAGVDNYITVDGEGDKRTLRALTDRECLRLMGYPDTFKIVVSSPMIYRQAGNSIVVDVMMAVVREIINTGVFDNKY